MNPVACNIPRVGDALERPRLFDLMAGQGQNRVVLLTGQAAQGKSTLVASFLDREAKPCIWVHLNRKASDHSWLFGTLFKGLKQLSLDTEKPVQAPCTILGSREDMSRQLDILVTGIGLLNRPLDIVFDDLETLDDEGSSWVLIKGLMDNTRDHVRYFLLSRTQPPLSLTSLKMESGCLVITNQDLAFTRDEIKEFFRKKPEKGGILPAQIEKIHTTTEGWAGGVVLVSESLRRSMDLSSLPPRLAFDAFSYFSKEIYGTLPREIKRFLMETSIFDELDIKVLSSFFYSIDPLPILEELVRRNLFIQKISSGAASPVFKYNNLFRDFLSDHLKKKLGKKAFRQLNKKAGKVFWEKKKPEEAIRYFMAGSAHGQVAKIIRIKGTDYVIGGREACLGNWIMDLPKEIVDRDPWLIFFKATASRIKGGKKNLISFEHALAMFRESGDTRGILLATAYLIEAAVFLRQPSHVIVKWIESGMKTLAAVGGELRFVWARTLLWQQMGFGFIAGSGDIPKGISACRNAILLAGSIGNQDLLLTASIILCLGLVQAGDFSGARQMLDRSRDITHEGGHPEYRALNHMTNIDFALKKGDFALAGDLLVKIEADIEKFGLIFLYPGFVEARAVHGACTGQFSQALKVADQLHDFSILEGNDFYLGISHRVKALAFLLGREYGEAKTFARMAVDELSNARRGDIHLLQARKIYGLSLFHVNDFFRARKELVQALEYFDRIGSDLCFCETSLALGLLEAQIPNKDQAESYFKRGVQKAVDNKYSYFPLLPPHLLAQILVHLHLIFPARAGTANRNQGSALFRGQVAAFSREIAEDLSTPVREAIYRLGKGTDKKQKAEQMEKLSILYRMSRPKIQIFTLGEFSQT